MDNFENKKYMKKYHKNTRDEAMSIINKHYGLPEDLRVCYHCYKSDSLNIEHKIEGANKRNYLHGNQLAESIVKKQNDEDYIDSFQIMDSNCNRQKYAEYKEIEKETDKDKKIQLMKKWEKEWIFDKKKAYLLMYKLGKFK